MSTEIILTLTLIGITILLFATERLRVDVIALLVLLTLALSGLISPTEALAGFASPAVVTVWAVYIVSAALFKTGVTDFLGNLILRFAGSHEARLIAVIMLTCGTMSAFMNNIGATAVLLPAVVGISRRANLPLSRLLIPLSFSSLLGGNMTLIGTPPNILASNLLAERNLSTFSFFDFTPTGIAIFLTGITYMVLVGRHLLPVREAARDQTVRQLREYVSEVRILPGSPLCGKTLVESRLGADYDLTVIAILRDGRLYTELNRLTHLLPDDCLILKGVADKLIESRARLGLAIQTENHADLTWLSSEDLCVVEAILAPGSPMIGRTLRQARFRNRYGFSVLAICRHGSLITRRLRDVPFRFGDTVLIEGPRKRLQALQDSGDFLVLEPLAVESRRHDKAPVALVIMASVLVLSAMSVLPISIIMLAGALAMVVTGCLTMDEAYQSIEWRSVFLIAGMLPLGTAMESTGTARFLADLMIGFAGQFGPLAILAGVFILAGLTTEIMSNAATTVLIVPIAIDVALTLGASPRSFVLAAVIGASISFLTPVGHQANVLVFGPGEYRFTDYTRVGGPLTLTLLLVTMIVLPVLWPLFPD
jgi:di/tricarboxylate transporter